MHLQDTVTLTPSTVTRVSTGEAATPTRRYRSGSARARFAAAVTAAHPLAVAVATELADDDLGRLWVDPADPSAVWVLNHSRGVICDSPACPACGA